MFSNHGCSLTTVKKVALKGAQVVPDGAMVGEVLKCNIGNCTLRIKTLLRGLLLATSYGM